MKGLYWPQGVANDTRGCYLIFVGLQIIHFSHFHFSSGFKSLISAVSDFKSFAKIVKIPQTTFTLPKKSKKI